MQLLLYCNHLSCCQHSKQKELQHQHLNGERRREVLPLSNLLMIHLCYFVFLIDNGLMWLMLATDMQILQCPVYIRLCWPICLWCLLYNSFSVIWSACLAAVQSTDKWMYESGEDCKVVLEIKHLTWSGNIVYIYWCTIFGWVGDSLSLSLFSHSLPLRLHLSLQCQKICQNICGCYGDGYKEMTGL